MADTTVDLITLVELKPGINQETSETGDDVELAVVITAVSQRFRDLCGPIVNTTFTDEAYDGGCVDVMLRNAGYSRTVTTTISAVKEYDTAGALTTLTAETATSKPADGYILGNDSGEKHRLIRRSSGYDYLFAPGRSNVLVTYTSGRAANTAAVPPKFKEAAIITCNHVWSLVGAQSGAARVGSIDGLAFQVPSFTVPKGALDLIRHELTNPVGVG